MNIVHKQGSTYLAFQTGRCSPKTRSDLKNKIFSEYIQAKNENFLRMWGLGKFYGIRIKKECIVQRLNAQF